MGAKRKTLSTSGEDFPARFTVQICSKEGRLLSEYLLSRKKDRVRSLAAAERKALDDIAEIHDEQLVVVVSTESGGSLKQVHRRVARSIPEEN